MFEELIAQGKDMIRRLERLVGLTYGQLKARPAHEQVANKEAEAWQKSVEERIRSAFGPDTLARYKMIWQLFADELERNEGDEITRSLNIKRRIVSLLSELQERQNASTRSPSEKSCSLRNQTAGVDLICSKLTRE